MNRVEILNKEEAGGNFYSAYPLPYFNKENIKGGYIFGCMLEKR